MERVAELLKVEVEADVAAVDVEGREVVTLVLVELVLFEGAGLDVDIDGGGGDWWAREEVTVVRRRRPGGRDMVISFGGRGRVSFGEG